MGEGKMRRIGAVAVACLNMGILCFFLWILYREATRFPVELVGPGRRNSAILAGLVCAGLIAALTALGCRLLLRKPRVLGPDGQADGDERSRELDEDAREARLYVTIEPDTFYLRYFGHTLPLPTKDLVWVDTGPIRGGYALAFVMRDKSRHAMTLLPGDFRRLNLREQLRAARPHAFYTNHLGHREAKAVKKLYKRDFDAMVRRADGLPTAGTARRPGN